MYKNIDVQWTQFPNFKTWNNSRRVNMPLKPAFQSIIYGLNWIFTNYLYLVGILDAIIKLFVNYQ